ncbi:MAG: DUF1553 domain-containing protein, partial [Planctomycetes bacterium]|nr:DUF1553 domain-containing protein [Planctomycetota bacterium]
KVAVHLIYTWSDNALKVTTRDDVLNPNEWQHVFVTYDGSSKAAGVTVYVNGKPQPHEVNADSLSATTVTDTPLQLGKRNPGSPFTGGSVDDMRIYGRTLSEREVAMLAGSDPIGPILALERDKRSPEQIAALRSHYLQNVDETYRGLADTRQKLDAEHKTIESQMATTLVFRERKEPKPAYILIRGEYDKHGEEVPRATPAFLPPYPESAPRDRLGLAKWLLSDAHPLTARVAVNRFWQQCFGTGLVKTSEDFGSQGHWPSHPELLDWLAVEFRESPRVATRGLGWNIKRLMKLIVMSAAYRQDSRTTPELVRRDPENRLLARGPRFRLDAEMLRDQALKIGGQLVERIGGPSVKPPQPAGIWEAVGYSGSNTVKFQPDTGNKVYRRSVYTFWKRTAPPPQMTTFDAPSRESCRVRRERTNTPLQALVLMNEEQFFEAARRLAERALTEGGTTPADRAAWMFRVATARPPQPDELESLLSVYRGSLEEFAADAEAAKKLIEVGETKPDESLPPAELAAWTLVANTVLNLDEVIAKN